MQYLIIAPDYTQFCIRDEFNGVINPSKLNLPKDYLDKLLEWEVSYRKIIPLDMQDRNKQKSVIKELDSLGINLAKELQEIVGTQIKVKYFSEGLLQYMLINE